MSPIYERKNMRVVFCSRSTDRLSGHFAHPHLIAGFSSFVIIPYKILMDRNILIIYLHVFQEFIDGLIFNYFSKSI